MQIIFRNWINKYFADEEAIFLLTLLITFALTVWLLGDILAPFFASIIIAYILQGLVSLLMRCHLSHLISVVITFLLLIGLLFLSTLFLLPNIWVQITDLVSEWPSMVNQGQAVILKLTADYPDLFTQARIDQALDYLQLELTQISEGVLSYLLGQLPGVVVLLVYIVLVPILVFFSLKDWPKIAQATRKLTSSKGTLLSKIGSEMDMQIANYIRGKAIEILVVGVVSYIVFAILGLQYALLLALLVGLSVLVPYVGAFSVTIPVAIVGFVQWGWSSEFAYLLMAYLIIQILDGNVLVPIIFSEAVNLHPVTIILAVLVFGGIWGFWGVFFAIPLATLIKAIINAWPVNQVQKGV